MKIKFKEMAEYINYCSDSKITNYKTGEVKMIGVSLDKGIFAYYNPKDKTEVGGQAVLGRQVLSTTPWLTERHGYDPTFSDQNPDRDKYTLILANPPFKGSQVGGKRS